mgnify:CR=1 FL=1
MKRLGLFVAAVLMSATVSFANNKKIPFSANTYQLSCYLQLTSDQVREVENINEYFHEMQKASLRASEDQKEVKMQKAIAIDFDGCLCTNEYPNIGKPILHIIDEAKKQQAKGAGLILWTCRQGKELEEAVAACERWGLHFDAVNENLPSWKEFFRNDTRKVGANEYWDDRAVIADQTCILRSDKCFKENQK